MARSYSSANRQKKWWEARARCCTPASTIVLANLLTRSLCTIMQRLRLAKSASPQATNATVDSVDVTVKGMGGHGAYPHKTKDPITLSAEIINAWQTIASRETNPHDDVVVTVGSIHGGTKHNIISDEVKMQLTVRTYKKDVRDIVLAAIDR